jgi:hypothetical protein
MEMNTPEQEELNSNLHVEQDALAGLEENVDMNEAHEDAEVVAAIAELEEEEHFDSYDLNKIYDRVKTTLDENKLKDFKKSFVNARRRYKEIFEEERNKVYQAFIDSGEKAEDFKFTLSPDMVKVKEVLNTYQDRLTEMRRKEDAELQTNLLTKRDIVHELKDLISNESDIKKAFEKFNELRNRWKETGPVPAQFSTELWNNYKFFSDKFYEFVEINKELFEVELQKNEVAKEALIQRVEALLEMNSIQNSIASLHSIQKEWREMGPVHKDRSEDIWSRFKAAVDKVYTRRDEYLKGRDEKRHENLALKTAICEKAEVLAKLEFTKMADWKEKENELKALDEEWKKIGRVPTKHNESIWERFKIARKEFFKHKYNLLKGVREELQQNYQAKIKLCEAAEALKESTDWKGTAQKLIRLQGDWKKIGPIERKKSDEIWNRFRAACDAFFQAKEQFAAGQGDRENENLAAKQVIIDAIIAYTPAEKLEDNFAYINEQRKAYQAAGFVPIAEKQKIDKALEDAINGLMEKLHIDKDKKFRIEYKMKLEQMLHSGQADKLLKEERTFVGNRLRKLQEEVAQLENNIGFFGHNKGANIDAMKKTFTDKIEKIQVEITQLEDKRHQLKTAFKQLEGK